MKSRLVLLLLLVLTGVAFGVGTRGPGPSSITVETPTHAPSFNAGFLEHLLEVQTAADALVDLGERRERNLLEVGQRQAAMNSALDTTDAWLAQQAAPHDDPAVIAYRGGAAEIRQAMADAQSAFLRFDWDGIAAANVTLQLGAAEITTAEEMLLDRGDA